MTFNFNNLKSFHTSCAIYRNFKYLTFLVFYIFRIYYQKMLMNKKLKNVLQGFS